MCIACCIVFVFTTCYNLLKGVDIMKADTITMRVNPDLKRQAEALCNDMGFTLSTAYTMLLKAIVRTRTLPFPLIASDPFYSDSNMTHLRRGIEALNSDKGTEHELIDEHAPIS